MSKDAPEKEMDDPEYWKKRDETNKALTEHCFTHAVAEILDGKKYKNLSGRETRIYNLLERLGIMYADGSRIKARKG